MSRRLSEESVPPSLSSEPGYGTPKTSLENLRHEPAASPSQPRDNTRDAREAGPSNRGQLHTPTYDTHAGVSSNNRVESNAPLYSENPYIAEQRTEGVHEFPEVQRHATHASEHASTMSRRNRITESIRSLLRRDSRASSQKGRSSTSNNNSDGSESKDDQEEKEKDRTDPPQTVEEWQQQREDPKHLLNTILEEPDESAGTEVLVPISQAAAEVSSIAGSDQPTVKERRKGYRENLLRSQRLRKYTKASRTVNWLRRSYNSLMRKSMMVRLFVYWFPLALILFVPLAVGAWQNQDMRLGGTRVMFIFIWLEVVWASLFLSRVFARYMPEIFGFFISIFAPRFFKYINMVVALELAVQLVLWTFVTFISFAPILTDNSGALNKEKQKHMPRWQKIIQEICVAFLVSAIVFFCEQVFMYLLSTSFHRTRMSVRIQNQKKSVSVLVVLLDLAYSYFPWNSPEFRKEDQTLKYSNLKRAKKVGTKLSNRVSRNRVLRNVNKLVGNAARNVGDLVADDDPMDKPPVGRTVKDALARKDSAEVLANRIWKSLVMEDSDALTYEDLISALGPDRKEEVLYMFDVLDRDGRDGIDLEEMITSVQGISRESKQISKSLIDIDGAITKLHHLLLFLCLILVVIIFVGMLAPSSATVLATLGSTLLSMSFLFASTAQEVFSSCVFLFAKHPYDVGDWIQTSVPGIGLVRMQVKKLALMYTIFAQVGINVNRQVSNTVLNSQFIDNLSRSGPSQVAVVLTIGIPETTMDQLAEFKARLVEFVEANPRELAPGPFFEIIDHPDLDKMSLNICVNTRNSQDDILLFSARRTKILEFIGMCINDIPITVPRRDDSPNNNPTLPIFHYAAKDVDSAMKYAEKARGLRRPAVGMLAPPSDDDQVSEYHNPYVGVTDREQPDQAKVSSVDASGITSAATVARRQSFSSVASRAFSTMTRNSEAPHGLRTRRQAPIATGENHAVQATSNDNDNDAQR